MRALLKRLLGVRLGPLFELDHRHEPLAAPPDPAQLEVDVLAKELLRAAERLHPPPKGFEFMRSTVVVTRWDYQTLERALSDLCLHMTGDDWRDVATRLSRYGGWEFEDYRG
jgi:hypothetical protein